MIMFDEKLCAFCVGAMVRLFFLGCVYTELLVEFSLKYIILPDLTQLYQLNIPLDQLLN